MNVERIGGFLGLALRSRQAVLGTDACRILVRSGNCGVILLDEAAGVNTRKKTEDLCKRSGVPVIRIPEGTIEGATGKENMVMAVRKGSFAETIIRESGTETGYGY